MATRYKPLKVKSIKMLDYIVTELGWIDTKTQRIEGPNDSNTDSDNVRV
jgi:hypothetical protein